MTSKEQREIKRRRKIIDWVCSGESLLSRHTELKNSFDLLLVGPAMIEWLANTRFVDGVAQNKELHAWILSLFQEYSNEPPAISKAEKGAQVLSESNLTSLHDLCTLILTTKSQSREIYEQPMTYLIMFLRSIFWVIGQVYQSDLKAETIAKYNQQLSSMLQDAVFFARVAALNNKFSHSSVSAIVDEEPSFEKITV